VRIGSYNIAHGRGGEFGATNWQKRSSQDLYRHLDLLVTQINNASLDILVLNEADFSSTWSQNVNQAEYLMEKCGFTHRSEQTNMLISIPFLNYIFGNAVLSKYPMESCSFINFPALSEREDLLAGDHDGIFCKIKTPAGDLGLFVVHLEYRNEDARVASGRILNDLSNNIEIPVVAVGDFNSSPTSAQKSMKSTKGENTIEYLLGEGGFTSYVNTPIRPQNYTFPSEKPDRIIDWMIGKRVKEFKNSGTIQSGLSDHLMIVSEIDF